MYASRVVRHIPGETNPADMFTKILSRQVFEKHRKTVMNLPGDAGLAATNRHGVTWSSVVKGVGAP